jgi:hypothetical protein
LSKLKKVVVGMIVGAAALAPAAPAFAEPGPCGGQAPGPHCRPACFYYVYYDAGDPANGVPPTVELRRTFC